MIISYFCFLLCLFAGDTLTASGGEALGPPAAPERLLEACRPELVSPPLRNALNAVGWIFAAGVFLNVHALIRRRRGVLPAGTKPSVPWGMAEMGWTALWLGLALASFMVLEGWALSSLAWGRAARSDPHLLIFNTGVQSAVALLLIGRVSRRAGYSFRLFESFPSAFADLRRAFRAYLFFFPALVFLVAISFAANRLLGIRAFPHPLINPLSAPGGASLAPLLFLVGVVLAPLTEEIAFRGFLYPVLRRRFSVAASILLSSALFALLHRQQDSWLAIAGLGALLAWSYERTGNLSVPVFIHAIHNALFLAVALLLAAAR